MTDWSYLTDLLFLNPYAYFLSHPHVESIWIELHDPSRRIIHVDDPADVDPTPLALVLRRCDLTFSFCDWLRSEQALFFHRHYLVLPDDVEWTATLGGK